MSGFRAGRGFTLVEVVVALAIVAMTLAVVVRILDGGTRAASRLEATARALTLAESRLALLAGAGGAPAPGIEEGQEGPLRWRTVTGEADEETGLLHSVAEVSWQGGEIRLHAYHLDPRRLHPDGSER